MSREKFEGGHSRSIAGRLLLITSLVITTSLQRNIKRNVCPGGSHIEVTEDKKKQMI